MRTIDKESNTGKIIRALGFGLGITIGLANKRYSYKLSGELIKRLFGVGNKPKNLNYYFYRLRELKLVSLVKKKDGLVEVSLTEAGKKIFLRFNYEMIKIKTPRIWDRLFRVVVFDIPEKKKKARDSLTAKMRELGFLKFNNSVWIYPYQCQKEIDFIAQYWDIGRYIHFILAKDITNRAKVEKFFNL